MSEGFDSRGNEPLSRTERDRIDLQNEMAGLESGRPRRFLSPEQRKQLSPEERKRERERMSALYALLTRDPEYAALYGRVADKLDRAYTATDQALAEANAQVDQSAAELDDVKDRASTLPDGTKVFRAADGKVYTEDGRELNGDELGQVEWKKNAPSYEEFQAKKRAHEKALEEREAIERYRREVLDPARKRMNDPDNPPTKKELKDIEKDIEKNMPPCVRKHVSASSNASLDAYPGTDAISDTSKRTPSAAPQFMGEDAAGSDTISQAFDRATKPEPDKFDPSQIVLTDATPDNSDMGAKSDPPASDNTFTR